MSSPLSIFRKYQAYLLAGFGVLIMFVFVVGESINQWLAPQGSGGGGGSSTTVVSWSGGSISDDQLDNIRRAHIRAAGFTEAVAQAAREAKRFPTTQPIQRARDEREIVQRIMMARKAEELGLVVTDDTVLQYLYELYDKKPTNEGTSKKIRSELARILKDSSGDDVSQTQMFSRLREELLARQMQIMAFSGLFSMPPGQAWKYFEMLKRRVAVELVPVDVADFAKEVREPTDAEVQELFDKYKERFPNPASPEPGFRQTEKVAFGYLKLNRDTYMEREVEKQQKTITEEQIKEYYDTHRFEFRVSAFPEFGAVTPPDPDGVAPSPEFLENNPEPKPDAPKPDAPKPDAPKPDAPKPDAPKPDAPKPDAPKPDAPKPDAPKPDAPKPDAPKPDAPKPDAPKPDAPKPDAPKPDAPKPDAPKPDAPKPDSSKSNGPGSATRFVSFNQDEDPKPDAPKPDAPKPDAPKPDAPKPDAPKPDAPKPDAPKPDAPKPDAPKPDAPKPDAPKPDAPKPDDPKPDDPKPDAPKPDDPKPDDPKPDDPKPDDPKPDDPKPDDPKPDDPKPDDPKPTGGNPSPLGSDQKLDDEPKIKPLEEVRDVIRNRIARQQASEVLFDQLDSAIEQARNTINDYGQKLNVAKLTKETEMPTPVDFEALAVKHDMVYGTTPLVGPLEIDNYELGQSFLLYQRQRIPFVGIAYGNDQPAYKTQVARGAEFGVQFIFWKTETREDYVPKLKDIRDQVVEAWKTIEALELAQAEAEALAEQVRKAAKLPSKLFTERKDIATPPAFSWMSSGNLPSGMGAGLGTPRQSQVFGVADAGAEFMKSVFSLGIGETGVAVDQPHKTVYVVHVASETPKIDVRRGEFLASDYMDQNSMSYLAMQDQAKVFTEWYEELEKEMGVQWFRPPITSTGF